MHSRTYKTQGRLEMLVPDSPMTRLLKPPSGSSGTIASHSLEHDSIRFVRGRGATHAMSVEASMQMRPPQTYISEMGTRQARGRAQESLRRDVCKARRRRKRSILP